MTQKAYLYIHSMQPHSQAFPIFVLWFVFSIIHGSKEPLFRFVYYTEDKSKWRRPGNEATFIIHPGLLIPPYTKNGMPLVGDAL